MTPFSSALYGNWSLSPEHSHHTTTRSAIPTCVYLTNQQLKCLKVAETYKSERFVFTMCFCPWKKSSKKFSKCISTVFKYTTFNSKQANKFNHCRYVTMLHTSSVSKFTNS